MIDAHFVWEVTTPLLFHWNALRTLPDRVRIHSATSFAILYVLVVTWPPLLLSCGNCQVADSGPTCQRSKDMEGTSHVSLHRDRVKGSTPPWERPHRLRARFYNDIHGLSGSPDLTQRGL